jgi:hypothetical protein
MPPYVRPWVLPLNAAKNKETQTLISFPNFAHLSNKCFLICQMGNDTLYLLMTLGELYTKIKQKAGGLNYLVYKGKEGWLGCLVL